MNSSVLVVVDEPLFQNLLRLMLEPIGFRVSGAKDGLDALEKVRRNRPDVVILDVMMPDMDGIDVCKRLRGDAATSDLPIIMLSVRTHPSVIKEGLRAGATRYMIKPMSRGDLVANLRDVLSNASTPAA